MEEYEEENPEQAAAGKAGKPAKGKGKGKDKGKGNKSGDSTPKHERNLCFQGADCQKYECWFKHPWDTTPDAPPQKKAGD